jgi:hypothetical protein
MDIKKADSKGRVSGFEPGAYYTVVRGHTGTGFALNQVDTTMTEEMAELHRALAQVMFKVEEAS